MNLGELFDKYGSDKNQRHSYAATYTALLEERRHKVHSLLEVGVAGGGSLRAWRDYLPAATVVGVDISSNLFLEDRIFSYRADSTDAESLVRALGTMTFDVIIDDGDHHPDKQCATRALLWPRVEAGGLYVVEDIQWTSAALEFERDGAEIVDLRRERPDVHDNVLAIWRKTTEIPDGERFRY